MSEKAIVDIYYTYGKGDGDELDERFVINDTVEGRREIFENFSYDDSLDSVEDFINGEMDNFAFNKYGGDWDEPTGGYVKVSTKSDLINYIKSKAEAEVNRIEKLFEWASKNG